MKKFSLVSLLVFLSAFVQAQNISTHIPRKSTYIVTINPSTHIRNGDFTSVNALNFFSGNEEYGSGYNYIYGSRDLGYERKDSLGNFFKAIFTNPQNTGIDTTRKIFVFNETPDSIHYWAYLFPLNNSSQFGIYVSTHLFSGTPAIQKGSGYSEIHQDRISIGWTNSYAVLLLADYDYVPESGNIFSQMIMDSTIQAEQFAAANEQHIEDSIAYANALRVANDSVITDSLRAANLAALQKEQMEMLEKLAKDTTPEQDWIEPDSSEPPVYEDHSDYENDIRDSGITLLAKKQLNYLVNLSYGQSIQSISNFRTVDEEASDIVYWYNYGEMMQQYYEHNMRYRYNYYDMMGMGAERDTSLIHNMWKGSYVVSLVKFEGNTATMEQRSYFSPALQEHTLGLYNGRVNKKMFRYVKGENLMGFVAMSMNMEKFMKFYGSVYRENSYNSLIGLYQNYYMTTWDLLHVFIDEKTLYNLLNGEMLFAVTDLKPYTSTYLTYDYDENFEKTEIRKERTEIRPEFVFVAGIGKQEKAEEIIGILERAGALKKQNNQYYLINTPGEYDVKMFLALKNGMLIITDNEDLMVNHLSKGYNRRQGMNKEMRKLGRKSPLVGYWDGKKSFEIIRKNFTEPLSEEDKKAIELLQQEVNSGVVLGKKPKNGIQRIDVKIELNDPKPGSTVSGFVRFFQLLNSLYLIRNIH
jgi:hypothetical protein